MILFIIILYFVWEYSVLFIRDTYCKSIADKLPIQEQNEKVEPFPEQKKMGIEYISKYYQLKWSCEQRIVIPTPIFDFLNERFP